MNHRTLFKALPLAAALMVAGLSACQPVSAASNAGAVPAPKMDAPKAAASKDQIAVLAGGCFWGMESVFDHVKGVRKVEAGYSGGAAATAHYDQVSDGDTGHAESIRVEFDPSQISYGQLLQIYFSVPVNPTELNRQGPDSGTQYRSAIFYNSPEQQKIASTYITQLTAAKTFDAPIVTQVVPLKAFYEAEAYHQNYAQLHPDNPYIAYNDAPMVSHLKKLFPAIYKDEQQVVEIQLH
ncbi:peptide-methionine (S)-S-oxide reductase MsrA [Rhodanobacter sp. MP1X3]|uniref:peptide-methionine (S)-S-oxide reductase MsrA n=1 Tax=Rhodanobacter sp. MP1X3 TaxID=2723086 RepID=UPI001611B1E4|nr:peptide-methionine (S)-S-oxide reductase MsrA [Rhodanobacter sp. MP1X3]MBB6243756.1 peptide-methionine (S)-S-oxide reductase [Rhodanobacter sp. MP1X3]